MAVTIYRDEFFRLEKQIFEKFNQECEGRVPSNSQKFYGYGPFNTGEHMCLRCYISRSPEVEAYLNFQNDGVDGTQTGFKKINGKDLYDRARKFKNNPNQREMALDDIYEFVYFKYIGYDSIHEFRKKHFPEDQSPATITFRQFFYSYRNHTIKEAEVNLTFTPSGIKASQKGFLDQRRDVVLEGEGRMTRYCLRLSMESKEDDLMDLYLHVQYKDPKVAPMMLGIFAAQSAHHFPVSVETVLVRKDLDWTPEDLLQIERFLFLKRHHYRSVDPGYGSAQELRVKRPLVNTIAFLAGKIYRVWSYTKEGDIVQVRFVVDKNYKATLHSTDKLYDENDQEQTCLLSISDAINQRLIVTMHPTEGSGMLGTSILEIPNRLRSWLFTGVTCSVGLRNAHPSISYIALLVDDTDFKPDIIPHSKIQEYIGDDERLLAMHKELEKIRSLAKG